MEPEEYYDSLDEDSNYESIDNGYFESNINIPSLESDSVPDKGNNPEGVVVKKSLPDLSKTEGLFLPLNHDPNEDTVPFYERNWSKSDVENSKCSNELDTKSKTNKRRFGKKKSLIPVGKLKSKSYLDMFHAKKSIDKEQKSTADTSRATASDLTPKSYITDAESVRNASPSHTREFSETDSFYEGSSFSKNDYSVSMVSFDSKFCSVSQQNFGVLRAIKSKRKYPTKPFITKIPELGGLGPEIPLEKLESLKKRQQYGQKVSEKNKIKMQERRLLQSLQQEIKRCNNI